MSADGTLPPGVTGDMIAKRFGPPEYRCQSCGGFLAVERIKGSDGWTQELMVCTACGWQSDCEDE